MLQNACAIIGSSSATLATYIQLVSDLCTLISVPKSFETFALAVHISTTNYGCMAQHIAKVSNVLLQRQTSVVLIAFHIRRVIRKS